jgi:hypothetical protein
LAIAFAHVRARESAVERAARVPARTPEGLRAKAALLMAVIGLGRDHTMLAASLARDVAELPP